MFRQSNLRHKDRQNHHQCAYCSWQKASATGVLLEAKKKSPYSVLLIKNSFATCLLFTSNSVGTNSYEEETQKFMFRIRKHGYSYSVGNFQPIRINHKMSALEF